MKTKSPWSHILILVKRNTSRVFIGFYQRLLLTWKCKSHWLTVSKIVKSLNSWVSFKIVIDASVNVRYCLFQSAIWNPHYERELVLYHRKMSNLTHIFKSYKLHFCKITKLCVKLVKLNLCTVVEMFGVYPTKFIKLFFSLTVLLHLFAT